MQPLDAWLEVQVNLCVLEDLGGQARSAFEQHYWVIVILEFLEGLMVEDLLPAVLP